MDIKPMDPANRLSAAAADVAALRALTEHPERRAELRVWQAARLERTHSDLLASPRYRAATRFFLDELYGSKDFSQRGKWRWPAASWMPHAVAAAASTHAAAPPSSSACHFRSGDSTPR